MMKISRKYKTKKIRHAASFYLFVVLCFLSILVDDFYPQIFTNYFSNFHKLNFIFVIDPREPVASVSSVFYLIIWNTDAANATD